MQGIPTPLEIKQYPPEVRTVQLGNRAVILVGTAHVSQQSADLVRQVIEHEKPDCVCIELDQKRYDSLAQKNVGRPLILNILFTPSSCRPWWLTLFWPRTRKSLAPSWG